MSDANKIILVAGLESLTELDGRYVSLKCVNFALGMPKRGEFSLVFQAHDKVDDKKVAIKFYDPDRLGETYRLQCFQREPDVLALLRGSRRCIQLDGAVRVYNLKIPLPDGRIFSAPCQYFVCDWIDEDIDDYFKTQHTVETIAKLDLFRDIVLSVASAHLREVSHRDVHVKNFRITGSRPSDSVIAIDFGTSAAYDSAALLPSYSEPVGMRAYAAPECFLGLASDREIGKLTDIYSLGCLLFELFNKHLFSYARNKQTGYLKAVTALGLILSVEPSNEGKKRLWIENTKILRFLTRPPTIDGPGSSLPSAIRPVIIDLYELMVEFDYHRRLKKLSTAVRRLDSAKLILSNESIYQARLATQRTRRAKRVENERQKLARIEARQTALVHKC